MSQKEPVLLLVLVQTSRMRWLVAGIDFQNQAFPLLVSTDNDLAPYQTLSFDEQASFLRHRFCGVLQRGCDRLWGRQKKACKFVFLTDAQFPNAAREELTQRVADHLVEWMAKPSVAFLNSQADFDSLPLNPVCIAGQLSTEQQTALQAALPAVYQALHTPEVWEQVPPPPPSSEK